MKCIRRFIFGPLLDKLKIIIILEKRMTETLETLTGKANSLATTVGSLNTKLDEVRAFVLTLSLPQDKLDALGAILDAGNAEATAVLAEADALDEPAPVA